MASLAGAWRTMAGRRALTGLCGVAVIVAAGCSSSVGAGGGKTGSRHAQGSVAAPLITITPASGAGGVRPDLPVRVLALSGRLINVTVRTGGRDVAGQMNSQATQWMSQWALAPGAAYMVQATAGNSAGKTVTAMSRFRTLRPGKTFSAS